MPQIDAALIHAAVLDDGRQQVDKAYIFAEGGGGGHPTLVYYAEPKSFPKPFLQCQHPNKMFCAASDPLLMLCLCQQF